MDPKALWIKRLLKLGDFGDPVKKANTWEDYVKAGAVIGYVFLALFIGFILWVFLWPE
jgi:hypothetical protein